MNKTRCIILVPVYKPQPSADETASLRQLVSVLGQWEIRFVCPESLDMSAYDSFIDTELSKERFPDPYFEGIEGYNMLMRDCNFYRRFCAYEYLLVYQLDAWVFRDELAYWCQQGYDYIGAPWFKHDGSHEEGSGLWRCGNGGFSLRRTAKFIECTSPEASVYSLRSIFLHPNRHLLRNLIRYVKYPNRMDWFIQHMASTWEDCFFCYDLAETLHALHSPQPEEAARFAFEVSPAYLFTLIGNRLPFGCHAWRKYQFEAFWQQHIKSTTA